MAIKLICGVVDHSACDFKVKGIAEFLSLFMFGSNHSMSPDVDVLLHKANRRGNYLVIVEPGCFFIDASFVKNWALRSNDLCTGQNGITLISLEKWKQANKPTWANLLSSKTYVDLADKLINFNAVSIVEYVKYYKNRIWHINTESIKPNLQPKANIDLLLTPTAGLKSVAASYFLQCSLNSEIVFFDYSENSLKFKQDMLANWNGVDYPGYVRANISKNTIQDDLTHWQLLNGEFKLSNDVLHFLGKGDQLDDYWHHILELFDGPKAFEKYWKFFCRLKHRFVLCDLLSEADQAMLFETLGDKNVAVLNSNIFFTPYAYYVKPAPAVNILNRKWCAMLKSHPCLCVENLSRTWRLGYFEGKA